MKSKVNIITDAHGQDIAEDDPLFNADRVVCMGDVIDDKPQVESNNGGLQALVALHRKNASLVLGTHEYLMLRALGIDPNNPQRFSPVSAWLRNRGYETLVGYARQNNHVVNQPLTYPNNFPIDVTKYSKPVYLQMVKEFETEWTELIAQYPDIDFRNAFISLHDEVNSGSGDLAKALREMRLIHREGPLAFIHSSVDPVLIEDCNDTDALNAKVSGQLWDDTSALAGVKQNNPLNRSVNNRQWSKKDGSGNDLDELTRRSEPVISEEVVRWLLSQGIDTIFRGHDSLPAGKDFVVEDQNDITVVHCGFFGGRRRIMEVINGGMACFKYETITSRNNDSKPQRVRNRRRNK